MNLKVNELWTILDAQKCLMISPSSLANNRYTRDSKYLRRDDLGKISVHTHGVSRPHVMIDAAETIIVWGADE